MKPAKKGTQESAKSTTAISKKSKGFTDEERVAMKERIQELKAAAAGADKADGESAVLAKIAEMPDAREKSGELTICRGFQLNPPTNAHQKNSFLSFFGKGTSLLRRDFEKRNMSRAMEAALWNM